MWQRQNTTRNHKLMRLFSKVSIAIKILRCPIERHHDDSKTSQLQMQSWTITSVWVLNIIELSENASKFPCTMERESIPPQKNLQATLSIYTTCIWRMGHNRKWNVHSSFGKSFLFQIQVSTSNFFYTSNNKLC